LFKSKSKGETSNKIGSSNRTRKETDLKSFDFPTETFVFGVRQTEQNKIRKTYFLIDADKEHTVVDKIAKFCIIASGNPFKAETSAHYFGRKKIGRCHNKLNLNVLLAPHKAATSDERNTISHIYIFRVARCNISRNYLTRLLYIYVYLIYSQSPKS
jgi:hypothetical protein